MKINSFKATKVHGYLNFQIDFLPDVTFLIGINGSGKTSALKLILGLTSPSFEYLNIINFSSCEVICSSVENEEDITIRAIQNKDENSFEISLIIKEEEFKSGKINRVSELDEPIDFDEQYSKVMRHKEFFDNLDLVKKIRTIATPKYLGLDRKIYEGRYIDNRFNTRKPQHRFNTRRLTFGQFEYQRLILVYQMFKT
jgi:predicted ATP-binding protein involved in virulence